MVTRRHVVLLAVAFAASATWIQHADASTTSLRIRGIDVHAFPQVTVTASITGASVQAGDVHVTEDGRAVSNPTVTSLADSGREIDVVLALDTSNSMVGQPLASAIAAALRSTPR